MPWEGRLYQEVYQLCGSSPPARTEGVSRSRSSGKPSAMPVALPYMHHVSYQLKKVPVKCGGTPEKFAGVCPLVNPASFVPCEKGVVYEMPLSCGRCCKRHTGRCLNYRLPEHRLAVETQAAKGDLADH